MQLEPTPPQDAVQRYPRDNRTHVSEKTCYSTALARFIDPCDEAGIEDGNDLDSELIDQSEGWRLADE